MATTAPHRTDALRKAAREYRRTHGYTPAAVKAMRYRAPRPEDVRDLGEIAVVRYVSRKDFEGPSTFLFEHTFEGAQRPHLARAGEDYFVTGGGYLVQPLGIDDTGREDSRIANCEACLHVATHPPATVTGMGDADSVTLTSGRTVRLDGRTLGYAHVGRHWQLYLLRAHRVGSAARL